MTVFSSEIQIRLPVATSLVCAHCLTIGSLNTSWKMITTESTLQTSNYKMSTWESEGDYKCLCCCTEVRSSSSYTDSWGLWPSSAPYHREAERIRCETYPAFCPACSKPKLMFVSINCHHWKIRLESKMLDNSTPGRRKGLEMSPKNLKIFHKYSFG